MSAVASALLALIGAYLAAVVLGLFWGMGMTLGGDPRGLLFLAFGWVSVCAFAASLWFAFKTPRGGLAWLVPPLAVPMGLVSLAALSGRQPSGRAWSMLEVHPAWFEAALAQGAATGVMAWRLWPHWQVAGAFGTFCATVFLVALLQAAP